MMRRLLALGCLLVLLMAGCEVAAPNKVAVNVPSPLATSSQAAQPAMTGKHTLTVFAAASLTRAFIEMGQAFEAAHPGVSVSFNFAGSQILRTQIEQSAVADVFAPADQKNMELLMAENLVLTDSMRIIATNALIVIVPAGNPGDVRSLSDLARPGLKLILADASVPAGNYARQMLDKLGQAPGYGSDFSTRVLANAASNETDVRQVVTKIELGEGDAGIVYSSDAVAAPGLLSIPIPTQLNVTASYPIAVLSDAPERSLAEAFIGYVTSPDGQAVMEKWGFGPAPSPMQ